MPQLQLLDYIDSYIKAENAMGANFKDHGKTKNPNKSKEEEEKDKELQKKVIELQKIYNENIDKTKKEALEGYISKWYTGRGESPIYDDTIEEKVPHTNKFIKMMGLKKTTQVENPAITSFNRRLRQTKESDYQDLKRKNKQASEDAVEQKYDCGKFKNYNECVVDLNQCKWHPPMTHQDENGMILQKTEGKCRDVLRIHDENITLHAFGKSIRTTPRALNLLTKRDFTYDIPQQRERKEERKEESKEERKGEEKMYDPQYHRKFKKGGKKRKTRVKRKIHKKRKTRIKRKIHKKRKTRKKKTKKLKRYGVDMKEKIINLKKSTIKGKKYTARVKNINTGKERTIHFGGKGYEQFKDSTGLGHYSHVNHGTLKRKQNYFNRHSGEKTKRKAVIKELKKSNGYYNAKILSHIYLW